MSQITEASIGTIAKVSSIAKFLNMLTDQGKKELLSQKVTVIKTLPIV